MPFTEPFFQVFYVDYGNVEGVRECDLRSIRQEFLQLPFQAVEACLCGVESLRCPAVNPLAGRCVEC